MKWHKIRPGVYQYGQWIIYGVPQTSGNLHWFVVPENGTGGIEIHPKFMLRSDAKRYVERLK